MDKIYDNKKLIETYKNLEADLLNNHKDIKDYLKGVENYGSVEELSKELISSKVSYDMESFDPYHNKMYKELAINLIKIDDSDPYSNISEIYKYDMDITKLMAISTCGKTISNELDNCKNPYDIYLVMLETEDFRLKYMPLVIKLRFGFGYEEFKNNIKPFLSK